MKNLLCFPIIILVFCFGCKKTNTSTTPSYIPINTNQSVVYDTSNLFSPIERDSLIKTIIQYENHTTNQAAILTLDSIPGNMDIQYFSTKVAESWGIGTKEKNNGLLITISKHDRKVAITTGLGTEKTISDYECKVIIERIILPYFKTEDYYTGTKKALDSLFVLWD